VTATFTPIKVLELDLERALPDLPGTTGEHPHRRAQVLVRLHDEPLGVIRVELPILGHELAGAVWRELGSEIDRHLREDGLGSPSEPASDGIAAPSPPRCLQARDAFLERAPEITALIPSRERPERLRRCVESILACEYPSERIEVLVVDNAPEGNRTERLVQELEKATGRVRYAREDVPGSASARNRGLTLVRTPLVAMTDDDVIVDRHWLTEVARAFDAYPRAGAVSGLLLPAALDTEAQVWFEQYGGFGRGFRRRVFDLGDHRPPDEPLYPWNAGLFGTGNNFSFRTDMIRDIGGFDPALGNGTPALGGVDSEVLLRTILNGHQIVYEPRAIAHHMHRPDYEALKRQVYAYGAGLVAYYLKTILAEPRFALDFARKLPAGIRWMRSPDAHINRYKQDDYPGELAWIERRGMLYGPLAYARSRRKFGSHPVYRRRRDAARVLG